MRDRPLSWGLRFLSAVVLFGLAVGCNTAQKVDTPPSPASQTVDPASKVDPDKTSVASTVEEPADPGQAIEELVYDPDSLTFDISLSAALRSADNVLFLKTPANVNLNEIPDDLDKWLSRIRDKGGTVKAAPLPPDGRPSRSLLGILIDVILFFVGLAKDEIIFSAVDDFDAVMYFDKPTGDVKWIVFTRAR
ncbi:hypothetical protein [Hwanghaeella sp.]|uniref:hypothetical protein n=1 Tax=Hwanghaeella sp. TaxID=2605943 RepID=UPI003CCC180E